MCELLALCFNLPVRPRISFKGFKARGEHNPDGWGLTFYPDNPAAVFKEPLTAADVIGRFQYLTILLPPQVNHSDSWASQVL